MLELYQERNAMGNRIAELRKNKGLTQQQLADIINVQRNLINYWENGERDIKSHQIIELAECFGVSCDYILRGVKAENLDINKKTGLADKTIAMLEAMKKSVDRGYTSEDLHCSSIDILDYLIGEKEFHPIFTAILKYTEVDFKISLAESLKGALEKKQRKEESFFESIFNDIKVNDGMLEYSITADGAKYALLGKITELVKDFVEKFAVVKCKDMMEQWLIIEESREKENK